MVRKFRAHRAAAHFALHAGSRSRRARPRAKRTAHHRRASSHRLSRRALAALAFAPRRCPERGKRHRRSCKIRAKERPISTPPGSAPGRKLSAKPKSSTPPTTRPPRRPRNVFLAGLDTREQADAIVAATHQFLAHPNCTRLGLLFPAAGALSRLVASALTRQGVPHYDAMGQMVPGLFETPVFQRWLELQRTPRLHALLRFLHALEVRSSALRKNFAPRHRGRSPQSARRRSRSTTSRSSSPLARGRDAQRRTHLRRARADSLPPGARHLRGVSRRHAGSVR